MEEAAGVSHEVRQELYRTAVAQARQDMILDLLAAGTIATAAAVMWVAGWPLSGCLSTSALGGGAATARGIARWRRLRRMSPEEAEASLEL